MNFYFLTLLSLLFGLFLSCSNLQSNTAFTNSVNQLSSPISQKVVLEVITSCKGAIFPKEGEIIQIRLFESGHFEYDDFPDYNPPKVTSRNVTLFKKESKLSNEETKELINLALQPDFLNSNENFPRFHEHFDTECKTKVKFSFQGQEKIITAINFWDFQYYEEDKEKYAPSLLKLLVRVEELKGRAIGRISTQWLRIKSKN